MATPWLSPPDTLTLETDEVHAWRASLSVTEAEILEAQSTLSRDELERAQRFRFQKHRRHFIVGRGILRRLLGRYLHVAADQLQFRYEPAGKPDLADEFRGAMLRFNISHSHGLALYAFTLDREIGIDVEQIRPDRANEAIARRFFSAREIEALKALPEQARIKAFFDCWSRKEAFIKAKGKGLSLPLNQFAVSVGPGEPAALLHTEWEPLEASRWSVRKLDAGPDYAAALAVWGHDWQLKCWEWRPPQFASDDR